MNCDDGFVGFAGLIGMVINHSWHCGGAVPPELGKVIRELIADTVEIDCTELCVHQRLVLAILSYLCCEAPSRLNSLLMGLVPRLVQN